MAARPPRPRWRSTTLPRSRSADAKADARTRELTAARLFDSAGLGAYSTVALVYLVRVEHLAAQQVGLALTGAGLAALLASPIIGRLADRGGAARLGAAALTVQAAAAAAMTLAAGSLPRFAALACLYALANQAQMAVRGTLVAAIAPASGRTALVARLRTVGNIGVSLGIPAGGLALAAGTAAVCRACLLASCAAYMLAAALMSRIHTRPASRAEPSAAPGAPRPLSDRAFVAFVLVTAVQDLQFPLLEFALPLWIMRTRAPRWTIAGAGLTNTLVVILLQVAVTRRVTAPRRAARVPIAAGLAVAAACTALAATEGPPAPLAVALLTVAVLALSLAEVGQVASGDSISFAMTPDDSHGAYQGLYAIAPGIAQTAGPALLATVMLPHGRTGWLAAAVLFAAAGPLTIAVTRARLRHADPPDHDVDPTAPQEPAMHVFAATRRAFTRYPITEWTDPSHTITLLGSTEHGVDGAGGAHALLIPDYTTSAAFDLAVIDTHRRHPIDRLLVFSEHDILRAAWLREHLDIPGQRVASALAYRDKVVMKEHWRQAAVPAARHAPLEAPGDLLAFAATHGYPIVVKPRAGMGSAGVKVLADETSARAWLAQQFRHAADYGSPWMAESFVDGRMFQVDGVYHGGVAEVCWPTAVSSLVACFDGQAVTSVTLAAGDRLVPRIQALVTAALNALPDPDGPVVFHAEVWRDAHGDLLMNEIASRIGGGLTRDLIELAFGGVDLVRRYVECTVDEQASARPLPRLPVRVAGEAGIPPRHGRLLMPPPLPQELAEAPWMRRAEITGVPGRVYRGAATSVDTVAQCLVTASSPQQATERLALFTAWCEANLTYDDPQDDAHAPVGEPAALAAA